MTKKELLQKRNEKWRLASQKIVDLRYNLEDILHMFDEEEKKSERYQQLLESIRQQVTYALGDGLKHQHIRNEIACVAKTLDDRNRENKYSNVISSDTLKVLITKMRFKIHYLLIAVFGAVTIKLLETLPAILQFISEKGGQ